MPSPISIPLICHPASPCTAITGIETSVAPTADGGLALHYRVRCTPGALRLPSPSPAGPADGLWQHTCCEAFIGGGDAPDYHEFNFSPSGQWAAYRFTDYRERDDRFLPSGEPRISLQPLADGFQLKARLEAPLIPAAPVLHLGLTVVIEAADGSKSYWALAHGSERPDFHLRQSFTLTLNRNTP